MTSNPDASSCSSCSSKKGCFLFYQLHVYTCKAFLRLACEFRLVPSTFPSDTWPGYKANVSRHMMTFSVVRPLLSQLWLDIEAEGGSIVLVQYMS